MSEVGQKELKTQERVTVFFQTALGYSYLGDWRDRENNGNVEYDVLRSWLEKSEYDEKIIKKVFREIDQAITVSGAKSIYDANK